MMHLPAWLHKLQPESQTLDPEILNPQLLDTGFNCR